MINQKSYVSNKKVLSVFQKHKLNLHVYKYGEEGGIRLRSKWVSIRTDENQLLCSTFVSPTISPTKLMRKYEYEWESMKRLS